MRWNRTGREGIEDRRGMGAGKVGGGLGLVGVIAVVLFNLLTGGTGGGIGLDPNTGGLSPVPADRTRPDGPDPQADTVDFLAFVLQDIQASWQKAFSGSGESYRSTTLVLFEQGTSTGCGSASSAIGPFYCSADAKVYMDLSFLKEMDVKLGAPGDFAQAYVLAHEVGHHVQNLLGTTQDAARASQRDPDQQNEISVRVELQADCFAGVWAHSAYQDNLLEDGDLEEGIGAASAVGDDRLQSQAGRQVNAETWTHGSSAQRVKWFRQGFRTGDPSDCDTFSGSI